METIKERLNKCLNDHILKSVTGRSTVVHTSDIEAFIAQELTLLAEEVEMISVDSLDVAAAIIRAHVKDLEK